MSWNEIIGGVLTNHSMVDLFVRSWVEMYAASRQPSNFLVDLFVRSWVEIGLYYIVALQRRVDLFVRSWVEIFLGVYPSNVPGSSTSSWGRELKSEWYQPRFCLESRPLREVVSWNTQGKMMIGMQWSRPLREVVSWNSRLLIFSIRRKCRPLREVVSWNHHI